MNRRHLLLGLLLGSSGIAIAVLIILLPVWILGYPEGLSTSDLLKSRSDLRTTLTQFIASIGLVGTFIFAGRTFMLTRRGQLAERYVKAAEQIGSENRDVVVAGVYALAQVGRDDPSYIQTIRDVLTALVRERTKNCEPVRAEVQAALKVLGRGHVDAGAVDLSGCCLKGARLVGARLRRAQLIGACLDNAVLVDADLSGANLSRSSMRAADFSGADLSECMISEATVDGSLFYNTRVENANFQGTDQSTARGLDGVA